MSRTDKRRPRRQIALWTPDDYRIELEQVGHEAYRLTEHDGISVVNVEDFTEPDAAQQAYINAQVAYIEVLAQFTLAPLPTKPSEIMKLVQADENDLT